MQVLCLLDASVESCVDATRHILLATLAVSQADDPAACQQRHCRRGTLENYLQYPGTLLIFLTTIDFEVLDCQKLTSANFIPVVPHKAVAEVSE